MNILQFSFNFSFLHTCQEVFYFLLVEGTPFPKICMLDYPYYTRGGRIIIPPSFYWPTKSVIKPGRPNLEVRHLYSEYKQQKQVKIFSEYYSCRLCGDYVIILTTTVLLRSKMLKQLSKCEFLKQSVFKKPFTFEICLKRILK